MLSLSSGRFEQTHEARFVRLISVSRDFRGIFYKSNFLELP